MPQSNSIGGSRPPVVAIVGHIDHGKSTLLDYIRRTNVVEGEAGGITQHLSAYEATHKTKEGASRNITFLDTPGHAAFRSMRSRGLEVADVAILVVSSDEGVKPQTLEALELIKEVSIPYIVALTKIDKPGANIERAKASLLEHGIYLEGMGGEVPFVALSSKSGEGVSDLLDLIVLAADLEGLAANPENPGQGIVIEAHVDNKRGNTATLIIEDGSVQSGKYVLAGEAFAPVRIMENFVGKNIKSAGPGSPVRIIGFSTLPLVGTRFKTVESKKEAEELARNERLLSQERRLAALPAVAPKTEGEEEVEKTILPLVIKSDVAGTGEAVMHELQKLPQNPLFEVRVVHRGVGDITLGDVQFAQGRVPGLIVGFNVKIEREARELAERHGVGFETFTIIYKLVEWLMPQIEERRPKQRAEERTGFAKVLKFFSSQKGSVVLGGRVEEGALVTGDEVKILRREAEVGRGTITSLQAGKAPVKKVEAGSEFGAQIKTTLEPAAGDYLEAFNINYK